MDAWVWVLIGFAVGLVVSAIFRLIFRKNPTAELEQAVDEKGAQLSKAEMKAAVLQEKLHDAENSLEEQHQSADADCDEKLAAVEAEYQEKINQLEKQFADLEVSFAAQLAAKEEEKAAAAGVMTGFASATAVADEQPPEEEPVAEIASWEVGAAAQSDPWLETASSFDEERVLEELELSKPGAAVIASAFVAEDAEEDAEVAEEGEDAEAEGIGALAKAVLAGAGAAVAAAVLRNDEDEENEELADEETDLEEAGSEGEGFVESASIAAVVDEPIVEDAASEETFESEEDEPQEETSHAGLAAAAVGAGAAAAVLAAADDDEQEEPEPAAEALEEEEEIVGGGEEDQDSAVPEQEEPQLVAEALDEEEDIDGGGEEDQDSAVPEQEEDENSGAWPGIAEPTLAAAGGVAAVVQDEDDTAVDEPEVDIAAETEETIEEEEQPQEAAWPEDTSTWQGEYFNNMNLEGEPDLVREDADVDFDWGMESPAPEIQADGFSVRWTRTADLPPGLYRFTVTSDDGARLFVNERLVISAWYDHTEMTFRREIELPGGPVELRLEYYENAMAALIRISWERIG